MISNGPSCARTSDPRAPLLPSLSKTLGVCALAFAAVLVASSLVVLAALATETGGGPGPGARPPPPPILRSALWIAGLITANAAAGFAGLTLGMRWFHISARAVLPVSPVRRSQYFGAIALTLGVAPLADLASRWASQLPGGNSASAELAIAAALHSSWVEFAVALAAISIGPAVAEELLFRGLVTSALLRYGRLAALVWPSLLFGIYHLDLAQGVGTALLGIAFGWIRLSTGSVLPSIVAHGVFNGAVLLSLRAAGAPEPPTATLTQYLWMLPGAAIAIGLGLAALGRGRPRFPR